MLLVFPSESDLANHLDRLNSEGRQPDVGIMDSQGYTALACLQTPGGDGWGLAYYKPDTDIGEITGDNAGWVAPLRYWVGSGPGHGYEFAWPCYAPTFREDLWREELPS